jgi:hypothetical protein
LKKAVDKAIEQVPGGIALVDAVLKSKFFWIPYIYGNAGYVVEGSVLVDPKLASANENTETKYLVFYTAADGELIKKEITEEEYYKNYM